MTNDNKISKRSLTAALTSLPSFPPFLNLVFREQQVFLVATIALALPPSGSPDFKRAADASSRDEVRKYDIYLSRERLVRQGFHPAVTDKSLDQIMDVSGRTINSYQLRPTKDEYHQGLVGFPGDLYNARSRLTRGFLFFRKELGHGGFDHERKAAGNFARNGISLLLDSVDIGGIVAQNIFAQGLKSACDVAMSSTQTWNSLVASTKIWDFFAGELFSNGPAAVFIAVAPKYSVGEFAYAAKYDPADLSVDDGLSLWCKKARKAETAIYIALSELHRRLQGRRMPIPHMGHLSKEIVELTWKLTDVKHIHGSNQFHSTFPNQAYDPPASFCLARLREMLKDIFQKRSALKVLYFEKTPFLDRRVLAVILRACPLVEMVGIYNCPLIHFADTICILDLIHEINGQRRKDGNPTIRALDFYPRYHRGMPYQHETAETYGLSWGPMKRDVSQRGFFAILLKAFMKSRALSIDLLFDKGKAFRDFLYRTPQYSLAVLVFLDALYRISDLRRTKSDNPHHLREAMYDLLKPVRVDLEKSEHDWPEYYSHIMGQCLYFCSSCGYEMLEEFFTSKQRQRPPHQRACAGCILTRGLEFETDHLKQEKILVLDHLFPMHNEKDFNKDAPLGYEARGLLRLRTKETTRPPPPPIVVNNLGFPYQPNFEHVMVRDSKIHFDSVQNLPTLGELIKDRVCKDRWIKALNESNYVDMYSRLCRRLCEESRAREEVRLKKEAKKRRKKPRDDERADGGWPDDGGQYQPRQLVTCKWANGGWSNCGYELQSQETDILKRVDGGMPDHGEELQPPKLSDIHPRHSFGVVVETKVEEGKEQEQPGFW
ncbi:ribosomal protein L36 [Ophiocordyceps camponoti-floridani]|uniref:Ribosomal protein L36 n=1 Tax=Ophiocordyceps camponoti-floridani TaxID=2030778 RepID=A0A8H4QA51_9HYPO|nr:ribosomal protein L36 [Ophiocordyceps camponoti-floridani]